MLPPGSNPTVVVALFRAATGGVSADFVNAGNTLLLSLRHFHANTGRGYTWTTSEPIPEASAHIHPQPSSGLPTPVATLASNAPGPASHHFSAGVHDHVRPRHTHTGVCGGRFNGVYDGSGTPRCFASLHRSRPAQGRPASTVPVSGEHRRRHQPGPVYHHL